MKNTILIALLILLSAVGVSAQDNLTARRPFGQHTQSFSATPTFDAGTTDSWKMTLTGNVTSSTLIGAEAGHTYTFEICQDGTGSRTFSWPSQMVGPIAILSSANVCTQEIFVFDGTSAINPTTATSGGGGSGTVNAGTTGQVTYYGANGTTVSGNPRLDDGATAANTLTYTGTSGISAPFFNATGSGSMSLIGTEGTPSGAAAGKDVLSLGDLTSHSAQVSNNGDSFRTIAVHQSTSPVAHGVVLAETFPQLTSASRGTLGQPFCEGAGAGDPGWCQLDLSLATNVINRLVKANQTASTVYNDQVNTLTTAGTLDLSASTVANSFRVENKAGFTASLSGAFGYDTTSNNVHVGMNSADAIVPVFTSTPADSRCVHTSVVSGNLVLTPTSGDCSVPGGAGALSGLTAAIGANSINNGDNAQTWNFLLTTAGRHGFTVTENSASTCTGTCYLWDFHSIASSTANPLIVTAQGTANGWNLLNNSGNPLWAPLGTGSIATPGAAHNLIVSQAGSAAVTYVPPVTAGKVLIDNGPGNDPSFQDPIVSFNYVPLFSAIAATGTQTSSAVRVSKLSQYGTLFFTWATITGSPSGCTVQIDAVDSFGNLVTNGSAVSVSPANGTTSATFTPAASAQTAGQMKAVFACSGTYPSTGTLTLDFAPGESVYVANIVPVSGTVTTTPPANASTNVAQLAGTTTDTNSGAKSAGTLRVVLATDQPQLTAKLLVTPDANSAINVAQVAGTTTDTNSGNKSAGTQRVVLATDQVAIATAGQGATGSAVPSGSTYLGGNGSGNLTGLIVCDNSTAVNMSTATTTQIIAISGTGGRTYICSIDLVVGAADNVALISGSGSNCASNQAGLAGGVTAASGWNFAANGGLTKGGGLGMILRTVTTNNEVCLVTSAATQLSGSISWTQF